MRIGTSRGSGPWHRAPDRQSAFGQCTHGFTDVMETVEAADWAMDASQRRAPVRVTTSARRCRECGAVKLDDVDLSPILDAIFAHVAHIRTPLTIRLEGGSGGAAPPAQGQAPPVAAEASVAWPIRAPGLKLDDCILPVSTRLQLDEALNKLQHHDLIYRQWGFERVDRVGRALTLAFYGAPGTGKTRTAEAIAGELGRPFLSVDAGQIESRYMGDGAKNVRAVFQAATQAGAVLFFDEADSLFGRRASTVSQGVDHEVNVLKSTLLVETERFDGVMILATNFERNFDPAFRRRIAWSVEFALPDYPTRVRLWDYHLIPSIPTQEDRKLLIDLAAAESDGLAGGDILMAMRTSLSKCVMGSGAAAALARENLIDSIADVRQAMSRLGSTGTRDSLSDMRSMFTSRDK